MQKLNRNYIVNLKSLDAQQAKALRLMKKSDSIRLAIKQGGKNLNAASYGEIAITASATRDSIRNSTDAVNRRDSKLCLSNSKQNEDLDAVLDYAEKENMVDEPALFHHPQIEESQSLFVGLTVPMCTPTPFELQRCATANDIQELRGKYDGQVQSVLDAINEATSPYTRTSSLRIKKHSGRHAVHKQPT